MSEYRRIPDPVTNVVHSVHSDEARLILKRYLKTLEQQGGWFERFMHVVFTRNADKKWCATVHLGNKQNKPTVAYNNH